MLQMTASDRSSKQTWTYVYDMWICVRFSVFFLHTHTHTHTHTQTLRPTDMHSDATTLSQYDLLLFNVNSGIAYDRLGLCGSGVERQRAMEEEMDGEGDMERDREREREAVLGRDGEGRREGESEKVIVVERPRPEVPLQCVNFYRHSDRLCHKASLCFLLLSHDSTKAVALRDDSLTHSHSQSLTHSHSHSLTHSHSHSLTNSETHTLSLPHSRTLSLSESASGYTRSRRIIAYRNAFDVIPPTFVIRHKIQAV